MRSCCLLACYGLAATMVLGCGGGEDNTAGGADAAAAQDTPDAAPLAPGWSALIRSEFTRAPGEGYFCQRLTVTEDLYINEFRAVAPVGIHHTVLTVLDNPTLPDGGTDCSAGDNAEHMIFGSGVGEGSMKFPTGVGMRVKAGQQLLLNLHLFNTTETAITGVAGTDIKVVPAAELENEAEAILMGPVFNLKVPPGTSTQTGGCTMNGDVTVVFVGPHMHQMGTYMKVDAERAGEAPVTIHDGPYDFLEQKLYDVPALPMKQGDTIRVSCTYDNPSSVTVPFGDSSNDEMCFATIYRYPAFGASFGQIICDSGL